MSDIYEFDIAIKAPLEIVKSLKENIKTFKTSHTRKSTVVS